MYGFIEGDDGNDYYFHKSEYKSEIFPCPKLRVEFNTVKTRRGYSAENVRTSHTEYSSDYATFFEWGLTRIRVCDIRDYSIIQDECTYFDVFDMNHNKCGKQAFFGITVTIKVLIFMMK